MKDENSNVFKKKFPHLYEEIKEGEGAIQIDGVEKGEEDRESYYDEGKEKADPEVDDFLRLCENDEEADQIIDYMEREGKISSSKAKEMRERLYKTGVRTFGEKRAPGEYPVEEGPE